jgi:hypothetical protein
MNYNFSTNRANQINANNDLAKSEAISMKAAFEEQGNTNHNREMSHIYGQASINDKMFDLVVKEYYKL